jgi:HK97 family phage portal protein
VIVSSFTGLQAMTTSQPSWSGGDSSLSMYGLRQTYGEIYRTQPNVRIMVDFLARNVAQCAIHAFRRVSDTDRERLSGHDIERWLGKPNPSTRRYRLIESLMSDLGIYFEAYWLKVRYREANGRKAIGLVRLPPEEMRVEGGLLPSRYVWAPNGREKAFALSEIVYFNGYNPTNPIRGLSPLETLRRILAEEVAVSHNREQYWLNAGRMEGVWELSDKVKPWTQPQQEQFREQWQKFSGGGAKAGMTAVGPVGATYKAISFSAKDSEYVQGGKLRREVCAAAYHIPQPMVGILDHATFSNIREQHKHTYQDTLAPWMEMITQEIEGQLLIECDDQDNVYTEFNIAAKLAGTLEEQINSLVTATGKPIMRTNEARARLNLPKDEDPESDRIAPQQGGPSDATANPSTTDDAQDFEPDDEETNRLVAPVLEATRLRQLARLTKLPAHERSSAFVADLDRWNEELAADLAPLVGDAAQHLASRANVATFLALDGQELAL